MSVKAGCPLDWIEVRRIRRRIKAAWHPPLRSAFSKVKAHLRKAAEQTIPRLLRRIGRIVTDLPTRMQKLLPACWLCSNASGIRCKA